MSVLNGREGFSNEERPLHNPRNGRAKIISDKLATCISDVVNRTAIKRLESCEFLGLKCKNYFA